MVVLLYCSIFKISFNVVFDSFYILSHLFVFVKPFFQIFSNSFFGLVFRLDVTFIYCITFLSVCQAFFKIFSIFFQAFLTAHVTAYLYYHFHSLLSTGLRAVCIYAYPKSAKQQLFTAKYTYSDIIEA